METTSEEPHDDLLLTRAGQGDRAAFTRLVHRHAPRLLNLAQRIVGDRGLAEDVVQETFTRAWRDAPRFTPRGRGVSSAGAWLGRVAVNLALDQARRPRVLAMEAAAEPADPAPSSEAALIARERQAQVAAAVRRLSPRQRAALALAYDEGLTNAAGAAVLGVSVGAFELLLVRARRALREAVTAREDL